LVTDQIAVRYGTVAMALHWLIAVAIIGMLAAGKYMHGLPDSDPNKFVLYQLHKSFGITILVLTVARVAWRFMHPVPPLPATMAPWERWAAHGSHFLLYALMLGLPLSGWLRVSTDRLGIPTLWFGLFEVPHFPLVSDTITHWMHEAHELMGNAMILLLIIHVGAALKHHFWDRDTVLKRMLPFTRVE
jgi:cytochrome b561